MDQRAYSMYDQDFVNRAGQWESERNLFCKVIYRMSTYLATKGSKDIFWAITGWLMVLVYKKADGKPRIVTYNFITKYIWLAEGIKLEI